MTAQLVRSLPSALDAFLVGSEARHAEVREATLSALDAGRCLRTTSYVLVETHALLQHRIGMTPVRDLHRRLVPLLDVVWVDAELPD